MGKSNEFKPKSVRAVPLTLGRSRTVQKVLIKERVRQSQANSVYQAMRKLTPQHRQYALLRASGEPRGKAYTSSVATSKANLADADRLASRLDMKKNIANAIEQAEAVILRGSLMSAAQIRDFVMDGLVRVAGDTKGTMQVRALELLGRTRNVNLFIEQVEHNHNHSHDVTEIKQRILDLIHTARQRQELAEAVIIDSQAQADGGFKQGQDDDPPPLDHPMARSDEAGRVDGNPQPNDAPALKNTI